MIRSVPPVRRWLPHAALALVAALALLHALRRPAEAHTGLRRSAPGVGDTVPSVLPAIRFWFTERVQLAVTSARLIGPDSSSRALTLVADASDPTAVIAAIQDTLAAGRWVVAWQTGGRDGHPVRGRFHFFVARAATDTPTVARGGAFNVALDSMMRASADEAATPLDAHREEAIAEYRVARWAEFVGLVAILGAVTFHFLMAGGLARSGHEVAARDASDGARQLGLASLVLLLCAGVARLYGETSALRLPGEPVSLAAMTTMATGTVWGRAWLLGALSALVALGGLATARRWRAGWRVAGLGALGLAATPALTGHAAATRDVPLLAIVADVVHVLGAGAWLGALLVLVMAGLPAVRRRPEGERGEAAAALLAAFHPVARASVLAVLATGLVSSWVRLRSIEAITLTSYGSLLLYKVFVFLFAGLIGLYNWQKVLPRMRQPDGPARLRRSATVELVVGAVVLALTAVLVATEPPDMQASAGAAGDSHSTHVGPQP